MSLKYKYSVDTSGKVEDLAFALPDYVAEVGWKVGVCINDVLPDVETLHEKKYLDAQALVKYKIDRQLAYPSLSEQADLQYWDLVNGTTTWKDAIAKVKSDNPKP